MKLARFSVIHLFAFAAVGALLTAGCGSSDEEKSPAPSGQTPAGKTGEQQPTKDASTEPTEEEESGPPACGDLSPCTRSTTSDAKCAGSAPFTAAVFCDQARTLSPSCKPVGSESGQVLWCCPCK
jgi:hypothetical protein